jgi:hypothetical protein
MMIRNYADAVKAFNVRGPVRSSAWGNNERPLDRLYKHKKLIQREEYFDVVFHKTVMARFYKPVVDDMAVQHERRLYTSHPSLTSRKFMWEILGHGGQLHASWDNRYARLDDDMVVPIYYKNSVSDGDASFSADLMFVDGKLDVSRSKHTPHYRTISSKEDKQQRADILHKMDAYINLALMRMPEFESEATLSRRLGTAFGGEGYVHEYAHAMRPMMHDQPNATTADVNSFFHMCQMAYNTIASKRGMEQSDFHMGNWHGTNIDPISKLNKPITTDEFRRAIVERIYKYAGVKQGSKRVEIPQFPQRKDYPRTNIST